MLPVCYTQKVYWYDMRHIVFVSAISKKEYECCGKKFKNAEELYAHVAEEHRSSCGSCGGCC